METLRNKRVAIIGDSDLVCKAIQRALHGRLHIEMANLVLCERAWLAGQNTLQWDLIIVAIASENAEPIAELASAHLIDCVGRVPVLIISSRPFEACVEFAISHVRFPFEPGQLCNRVQTQLMAPRATGPSMQGVPC